LKIIALFKKAVIKDEVGKVKKNLKDYKYF